jgi:flagellar hook-associated protein 2
MSRIQSSVGLITGIPIEETVTKLMAVAARPKDILTERTKGVESEKLAVAQLSSLLLALQFEATKLGDEKLFAAKEVTSSNPDSLDATLAEDGNPVAGNYIFTPVQTASTQQLLSQSLGVDQAIGAGSFTFGVGGFVDKGISLSELNGGAGVRRGSIRVTDRSGASAVIDLRFARTIDDVLRAINENTSINVTASVVGDAIKLTDNTGGSGNLSVQNVGSGTTATDLGLASINTAAATATGSDIFRLHTGAKLSSLNDGNGVQLRSGNDLAITLVDGSTLNVDLGDAATLGDVLTALNAINPAKLLAAISADGNRIELTDLTAGGGTFSVANVGTGTAAEDLGLTVASAGNSIAGRRLISGLRDTLLSTLKGGDGLGTLGQINITNRNNVSSTVNLAAATTLGEIVDAINAQAVGVTASINSARNGILLTDTTGATTSNLIVADGDATDSATSLGLVVNEAVTSINGGALLRQKISEATLLSSLNGGKGITVNDIKITDSAGHVGAIDLNKADDVATTIGDVIDRINELTGVGVEARISDTGDGIILVDTAGGTGKLTVAEVGKGTTAKDLRILGTAVEVDIEGSPTQVIDGSDTVTVTIDADDTLADLASKINELGRGVTASLFNDGTGQRLALSADKPGSANALLVDTSASPLALEEISAARDALVFYGTPSSGTGVLIESSTNEFENVVEGLNLTIHEGTLEPVTVSVDSTSTPIVDAIKEFVDAFNSVRESLDELTDFNPDELTTGVLFGTREALQVESDLGRLLSGNFFGVGSFTSLDAIGLSLNDKGELEFDETKFQAALARDPEAVEQLFTDETLGVSAKFEAAIERLAGEDSVLTARTDSLTDLIKANNDRIAAMDAALTRQRERLFAQFTSLESTIAKMHESLSALQALQIIPPLTSTSSGTLFRGQ